MNGGRCSEIIYVEKPKNGVRFIRNVVTNLRGSLLRLEDPTYKPISVLFEERDEESNNFSFVNFYHIFAFYHSYFFLRSTICDFPLTS